MSVWNSKYNTEFFTSNPACNYRIDLLLKNYTGGTSTSFFIDPEVIQEWQDDDPKTPIRGCTLKIKIITNNPIDSAVNISIEDFYSNEDDTWKAVLKRTDTNETLFVGYLLQDDCSDICVDYTHTFNLTFSDNLGLMKGVSLLQASEALPNFDTFTSITVQSIFGNPHKIYSLDDRWGILNIGDNFTIYSGGLAGTYTVINRGFDTLFGYWVYTAEDVPISFSVTDDIDYTYYGQGITGYQSLKNIFIMLIYSTGIRLPLNVMTKLVPVGGTTDDLLRDTFIDVSSFTKDGQWMNCYDILEMICIRFNACFFQAHGQWYFVRWDELYRYTTAAGATYQGNAYDADMNVSTITQNIVNFDFLAGKDMETGTIKSIVRPDLFINETFNYVPNELLKNQNLQELGDFLAEYVDVDGDLIKEYGLPYWVNPIDDTTGPYATRFIRVAYFNDITMPDFGEEKYRVVVLTGNSNLFYGAAQSNDIYVSKGDRLTFNFDFRTSESIAGSINIRSYVTLRNGTTIYYLDIWGNWVTSLSPIFSIQYNVPSGDNLNEWHSWPLDIPELPTNGVLNLYLFQPDDTYGTEEIYFRNMNCTINSFFAGQRRVIGQNHNTQQYINIKKNSDKEIFIDDSPTWYLKGALYLSSLTDLFRDRTIRWQYADIPYIFDRLGQATTQEALFSSSIPRYKFEGNLLFVNNADKMLTPFSVFNLKVEDDKYRFVPGKITINYHANMAEVTLHEFIRNESGITGNQNEVFFLWLTNKTYNFNYLYENN